MQWLRALFAAVQSRGDSANVHYSLQTNALLFSQCYPFAWRIFNYKIKAN